MKTHSFIFLLVLGINLVTTQGWTYDPPREKNPFFKFTPICDDVYTDSNYKNQMTGEKFWCIFGYPTSAMTDLLLFPTEASIHPGLASEMTSDSSQSQSLDHSSDRKKEQVKQYKNSLLYAVMEDAVDFNAGPDHSESVALSKALDMVSGEFPYENRHQLADRIVKANQRVMQYFQTFLDE